MRLLRLVLDHGAFADRLYTHICGIVFLLSIHPEVFDRLRTEVLEVIGPTERPTFERIREMKCLRAVLNGWSLTHER